jgi:CHAT domain-containing protein
MRSMRTFGLVITIAATCGQVRLAAPTLDPAPRAVPMAAITSWQHALLLLDKSRELSVRRAERVQHVLARAAAYAEDAAILVYTTAGDNVLVDVTNAEGSQSLVLGSTADLDHRVAAYLYILAKRPQGKAPDVTRLSRALYEELLSPVEALLHRSRIIIIADGLLSQLPFETLQSSRSGKFAFERYTIVYSPRLSGLLRRDRPSCDGRAEHSVLVFADPEVKALPRLPFTRVEAESIAALFPGRVRLRMGQQASKESLFRTPDMASYDILHFATHAALTSDADGIELSSNGLTRGSLTAREIGHLRLQGQLVVLSACSTGVREGGGSRQTLADAFLKAGASRVMATLWSVNDIASADFSAQFYTELSRGLDASEAVRASKLAMLHSLAYSHPYYWGSYVLVGQSGETRQRARRSTFWPCDQSRTTPTIWR